MSARRSRAPVGAVALLVAVATALAGCGGDSGATAPSSPMATVSASAADPAESVHVLPDTDPARLALSASKVFFRRSPTVVLAAVDDETAARTGAAAAVLVSAPLLLVGGDVTNEQVRAELRRLGARTIVDVTDGYAASARSESETNGPPRPDESLLDVAGAEHVHVDSGAYDAKRGELNDRTQDRLRRFVGARGVQPALSEALALTDGASGQSAAVATARAAGAWPVAVPGGDPRSSESVVSEIASAQALTVVGIGASFGDVETLTWRVRAAQTGTQLPGGGQLVLAGKRYAVVTAQGSTPYAWAAGKAASGSVEDAAAYLVEEAKEAAKTDAQAARATFVPAIEVPATVWNPGSMRAGTPVETADLEAVVDAAGRAGVYVLLRFEPGTATFGEQLTQAMPLIGRPGVGVALDVDARSAEGSAVDTAELNAAIAAIDKQVRDKRLPQKLVAIQVADTDVISDLSALRAGDGEVVLAVVGTASGTASSLTAGWSRLRDAAPTGAGWGFEIPARQAADATLWSELDPAPAYLAVRP